MAWKTKIHKETYRQGKVPLPHPPLYTFYAEALCILREMNTNQNHTNEKAEQLSEKVEELYSNRDDYYDDEYDGYDNIKSEEVDICENLDLANTSSKRSCPEDEQNIFSSYAEKFKSSEKADEEIDPYLTELVDNAFQEGISDEKFQELIKSIDRPANCEALKETRVNAGVWSIPKHGIQTEDLSSKAFKMLL